MKAGTVIQMSISRLSCTGCGAEANASCNCGKPYMPKSQRAADAIAANPYKSNRAIAAELGIGEVTVRRARETAPDDAVERLGLDGKVRRLPVRDAETDDDADIEADVEPANYRGAFLIRADQARQFASYSGPITSEIVATARQVATAWGQLAAQLEKSL